MMDRLKGRATSTQKLFSVALSLVATDYINSQTIDLKAIGGRVSGQSQSQVAVLDARNY